MPIISCGQCPVEFETDDPYRKYCSPACTEKSLWGRCRDCGVTRQLSKKHRERGYVLCGKCAIEPVTCAGCQVVFKPKRVLSTVKYCSTECNESVRVWVPRKPRAEVRHCLHCKVEIGADKNGHTKYCSTECRREAYRSVPCKWCGKPGGVHGDFKRGYSECVECKRDRRPHDTNRYNAGCRCTKCKTAKGKVLREYYGRTGHLDKPEVKAAIAARGKRADVKAKAAAQRRIYAKTELGRATMSRYTHTRRAKLASVLNIPFTVDELEARMSMGAGVCYICTKPLGEDSTIDHVKPIHAGGPNILANLKPAHSACNKSKGHQWPFTPTAA